MHTLILRKSFSEGKENSSDLVFYSDALPQFRFPAARCVTRKGAVR
jgi:hypothetical protein